MTHPYRRDSLPAMVSDAVDVCMILTLEFDLVVDSLLKDSGGQFILILDPPCSTGKRQARADQTDAVNISRVYRVSRNCSHH